MIHVKAERERESEIDGYLKPWTAGMETEREKEKCDRVHDVIMIIGTDGCI